MRLSGFDAVDKYAAEIAISSKIYTFTLRFTRNYKRIVVVKFDNVLERRRM